MEEKLTTSGDYRYVQSAEEGTPMVLLHGLFGALSNFDDVFSHFSGKMRVIIPMLPLFDMPLAKTGAKSLAKFVAAFLDHMGLDKVHLVGNSLGGHVGLIYARKHPERVASLTLIASSGLYENAFGNSFPRREDKEFIRKKVGETFFDPDTATDELVDECFAIVNDRARLLRILAIAKSAIRHNMAEDLAEMKQPTCLIWGRNDTITPPEVAEEFERLLPDADLFWIDECGHAPMMERPEQFNPILSDWYEKRGILD
jgi:2-hydroxy-6-oxonona-2,4-dienedioate hydrolase